MAKKAQEALGRAKHTVEEMKEESNQLDDNRGRGSSLWKKDDKEESSQDEGEANPLPTENETIRSRIDKLFGDRMEPSNAEETDGGFEGKSAYERDECSNSVQDCASSSSNGRRQEIVLKSEALLIKEKKPPVILRTLGTV